MNELRALVYALARKPPEYVAARNVVNSLESGKLGAPIQPYPKFPKEAK